MLFSDSQALQTSNYGSEPMLRTCGITIKPHLTQVDGRVLPAPRVFMFYNFCHENAYLFLVQYIEFYIVI